MQIKTLALKVTDVFLYTYYAQVGKSLNLFINLWVCKSVDAADGLKRKGSSNCKTTKKRWTISVGGKCSCSRNFVNSPLKATLNATYKNSLWGFFLPFAKIPINLFLPFVCELLTCWFALGILSKDSVVLTMQITPQFSYKLMFLWSLNIEFLLVFLLKN